MSAQEPSQQEIGKANCFHSLYPINLKKTLPWTLSLSYQYLQMPVIHAHGISGLSLTG